MIDKKNEYRIHAVTMTLLTMNLLFGAASTAHDYVWYTEFKNSVKELETENEKLRTDIEMLKEEISKRQTVQNEIAYTGVVIIDESDLDDICEPNPFWWKERLPENGNIDTNRYDCEPDKFGKGSHQRMLQQVCTVDPYTGIKVYSKDGESYYCAAMASAYGIEVGEAWRVTLECGSVFNVILSDFQQPITDPDPNYFGEVYLRDAQGNVLDILRNYDGEPVCHVLEFVADMGALHPKAKKAGNAAAISDIFGGLYGNGGNIIEMKYLGKVWEP